MELAVTIISFAILILTLCFAAFFIWNWKSEQSMPNIVTNMVLAATIFILEIPRLVLEVLLGKEYGSTIFLLVLWASFVFVSANLIRKKRAESECESEQD